MCSHKCPSHTWETAAHSHASYTTAKHMHLKQACNMMSHCSSAQQTIDGCVMYPVLGWSGSNPLISYHYFMHNIGDQTNQDFIALLYSLHIILLSSVKVQLKLNYLFFCLLQHIGPVNHLSCVLVTNQKGAILHFLDAWWCSLVLH